MDSCDEFRATVREEGCIFCKEYRKAKLSREQLRTFKTRFKHPLLVQGRVAQIQWPYADQPYRLVLDKDFCLYFGTQQEAEQVKYDIISQNILVKKQVQAQLFVFKQKLAGALLSLLHFRQSEVKQARRESNYQAKAAESSLEEHKTIVMRLGEVQLDRESPRDLRLQIFFKDKSNRLLLNEVDYKLEKELLYKPSARNRIMEITISPKYNCFYFCLNQDQTLMGQVEVKRIARFHSCGKRLLLGLNAGPRLAHLELMVHGLNKPWEDKTIPMFSSIFQTPFQEFCRRDRLQLNKNDFDRVIDMMELQYFRKQPLRSAAFSETLDFGTTEGKQLLKLGIPADMRLNVWQKKLKIDQLKRSGRQIDHQPLSRMAKLGEQSSLHSKTELLRFFWQFQEQNQCIYKQQLNFVVKCYHGASQLLGRRNLVGKGVVRLAYQIILSVHYSCPDYRPQQIGNQSAWLLLSLVQKVFTFYSREGLNQLRRLSEAVVSLVPPQYSDYNLFEMAAFLLLDCHCCSLSNLQYMRFLDALICLDSKQCLIAFTAQQVTRLAALGIKNVFPLVKRQLARVSASSSIDRLIDLNQNVALPAVTPLSQKFKELSLIASKIQPNTTTQFLMGLRAKRPTIRSVSLLVKNIQHAFYFDRRGKKQGYTIVLYRGGTPECQLEPDALVQLKAPWALIQIRVLKKKNLLINKLPLRIDNFPPGKEVYQVMTVFLGDKYLNLHLYILAEDEFIRKPVNTCDQAKIGLLDSPANQWNQLLVRNCLTPGTCQEDTRKLAALLSEFAQQPKLWLKYLDEGLFLPALISFSLKLNVSSYIKLLFLYRTLRQFLFIDQAAAKLVSRTLCTLNFGQYPQLGQSRWECEQISKKVLVESARAQRCLVVSDTNLSAAIDTIQTHQNLVQIAQKSTDQKPHLLKVSSLTQLLTFSQFVQTVTLNPFVLFSLENTLSQMKPVPVGLLTFKLNEIKIVVSDDQEGIRKRKDGWLCSSNYLLRQVARELGYGEGLSDQFGQFPSQAKLSQLPIDCQLLTSEVSKETRPVQLARVQPFSGWYVGCDSEMRFQYGGKMQQFYDIADEC